MPLTPSIERTSTRVDTRELVPATADPGAAARDFVYTAQDFEHIRKLVYGQVGISLGEGKVELVYSRLSRRLRILGLQSFREYCRRLDDPQSGEMDHLISAITTNTTHFFREEHHFQYLTETLVPQWRSRRAPRRVRIWSSACSSGEEPYSIAIRLTRALGPDLSGIDAKVLATDIDEEILARARAGVYPETAIAGLDPADQRDGFQRGHGSSRGKVRVRPELRSLIAFKRLNLMHPFPVRGPFQAIFCRNVLIYFDERTRLDLVSRLRALLEPGGILFLGHSETLTGSGLALTPVGTTTYRRDG